MASRARGGSVMKSRRRSRVTAATQLQQLYGVLQRNAVRIAEPSTTGYQPSRRDTSADAPADF